MILVGYLLVLAVAAVMDEHRALLALPGRIIYSLIRLIVFAGTLGRMRLAPPARQAFRHQRLRARNLQGRIDDWRERRSEERLLASGEKVADRSQWISGSEGRLLRDETVVPDPSWDQPPEDERALKPLPPADG